MNIPKSFRFALLTVVSLATAFAATINVPPGGGLQAAINAAANNDVLILQSGSYTTNEAFFYVRKPLTIVGEGIATVIQAPAGAGAGINVESSGVTIEALRVTAAQFGVSVGAAGATLTGIVLRDIRVDSATTGHGIVFARTTGSLIYRCTVVQAHANGIYLDDGSNNNVVTLNEVQATVTQHAFALRMSDNNVVTDNRVTGSGFDGIILVGAQYNRIQRNTINGHSIDGITLTAESGRSSIGNYVAQNTISANTVRTDGTGIWLNTGSNGNYVFGNTQSGAVEAGINASNASSNWIRGNVLSQNGQAGILIWNSSPPSTRPEYTTVHNNRLFSNPANYNILVRGGWYNDIGYNFLTDSSGGVTFSVLANPPSGNSGSNQVYENTFRNLSFGLSVEKETVQTRFFRNRFLNVTENFVIDPADASFDASRWLGGNFWSDAPGETPYSRFLTQTTPVPLRSGRYKDRYPFQNDSLGDVYSIGVDAPVASTIAAAGSRKTIAWRSKGCTLVDLFYLSPGGTVSIAANYPDHGFYQWTVPAAAIRADYRVRVDCKNAAGQTQATAQSNTFTIAAGDIVLLAPGPEAVWNGGATVRVAWTRPSAASAANISYRIDTGSWIPIASNVLSDNALITLPSVSSSRVSLRVQSTTDANQQDSTDRYFTIRSGASSVLVPNVANPLVIGSLIDIEWVSPQGSTYVDISLYDSQDQVFRPISTNLPDFGRYRWLVPELYMTGGFISFTFKNSAGATISTFTIGQFNVRYSTAPGTRVPFYRLYSPVTQEHMYTTSRQEYDVLGANFGWVQEKSVGDILNGPLTVGGQHAIPYYRLYNVQTLQHLWTTSRFEYFSLRESPDWVPENFVGYVFPTQVTGTIPYYRLVFFFPPYYHHWTTSACEHNALLSIWKSEGVVGYIYPNGDTDTSCTQPAQLSERLQLMSAAPGAAAAGSTTGKRSSSADISATSTAEGQPVIEEIRSAATLLPGAVSPGQSISIVGRMLGPVAPAWHNFAKNPRPETELGSVKVFFDETEAPMLFAAGGEIRALVPYAVADKATVQVRVEYNGVRSEAVEVPVSSAVPGLFTADRTGTKQAMAANEDGGLNGSSTPAAAGSVVAVFLTGVGLTDPSLSDGESSRPDRLAKPLFPIEVELGGSAAEILSAVAAPGTPGVFEVRFRVPAGIAPGVNSVVVRVAGTATQADVTLTVN